MPSIQQALERIIAVEVKEKRKTHHHHPMTSFNSVTSEKKKNMFCYGRKFGTRVKLRCQEISSAAATIPS
jgi:hypothetical protein